MKVILDVTIPHEPFNTAVKDGTVGSKINRILAATKPEAVYFTGHQGQRGATLIVNMKDASQLPAFCEPWFLTFQADIEFRIAMTPADLKKAALGKLGKAWA
jgi:hypothetical protein